MKESDLKAKTKDCQNGATFHNNEYLYFLCKNTTIKKFKRDDGIEVYSFRLFDDAIFEIRTCVLEDKKHVLENMLQIYYLGHIGNTETKLARELIRLSNNHEVMKDE